MEDRNSGSIPVRVFDTEKQTNSKPDYAKAASHVINRSFAQLLHFPKSKEFATGHTSSERFEI